MLKYKQGLMTSLFEKKYNKIDDFLSSSELSLLQNSNLEYSKFKLLFCINSGRVGSMYLSNILSSSPEVVSYHEPEPKMIGKYVRMIENQSYSQSFHQRYIKCVAIKNRLKTIPQNKIYCETSNMFIKTFFDVVINDFKNIEVIILRRKLPYVVKSFIECGCFSDKNKNWNDFIPNPNSATAAIKCIDIDKNLDAYDKCIAYLIDIEARAIKFQEKFPNIKIHNINIDSLNNYNNIQSLFLNLGINTTVETNNFCGKHLNKKTDSKKTVNRFIDLDYCQNRINKYLNKAINLGINIPETLFI